MSVWLEVQVDTLPEGLEPVGELLTGLGIPGYVIEDEADFLDFLEKNRQYWDYVDEELLKSKRGKTCVKFYVPDDPDGHRELERVRRELERFAGRSGMGTLETSWQRLREEDWENNWKRYYKPFPVGNRLVVIPEWETAEEYRDRLPIILNPGLIFGTGMHPSTQMCMEALERNISGGERVLDLGCGSGILSIAALRLGAETAVGCDIDPKAADVAYGNAALNGIGRDRYAVYSGDVLTDGALRAKIGLGCYPVVLANIVADVILALTPEVGGLLAEDGVFIASGIIGTRAPEVFAALDREGLAWESREQSGWVSVTARQKAKK